MIAHFLGFREYIYNPTVLMCLQVMHARDKVTGVDYAVKVRSHDDVVRILPSYRRFALKTSATKKRSSNSSRSARSWY